MSRTPKQIMASTLRRREYAGCHGQTSYHGCGRYSIQIYCRPTPENRKRFPYATPNAEGSFIVADFDLS